MKRRTYLLGCTAAVTSLAGCAGESGGLTGPLAPELAVSSIKNSEGRIRERSHSGNEYTIELENEGISGPYSPNCISLPTESKALRLLQAETRF